MKIYLENTEIVDIHNLANYMDKTNSLEGNWKDSTIKL